ncbi:LysE family translocator [uncultured Microbulbifer sp.]|uniref:LysE family translocator n=1 Tax=uncultured Microbulbifer sp. TaxID=348147 RepID=UPI00260A46C1|nr:LysE family translocator [uncultured Microbulbifer sp.]
MTLISTFALFGAMVVLAAIPGPGIFAVMARSASGGMAHGVATSIGIVFGDYIFIALCLSGLAYVADMMGSVFVWIKYLGAAYLLWLGISLLRTRAVTAQVAPTSTKSLTSSVLIGLTITLGNPKAILFYVSFFPAFLPLAEITLTDMLIIFAITTVSVVGVMLIYAWITVHAQSRLQHRTGNQVLSKVGGALLVASGLWMAMRGM